METIKYYLYETIDGVKIYKPYLLDRYMMEFYEDGKLVNIHFYFDYNGDLLVNNVYKNMKNYKSYCYIKKYAGDKTLRNIMMRFKR